MDLANQLIANKAEQLAELEANINGVRLEDMTEDETEAEMDADADIEDAMGMSLYVTHQQ